MQLSSITKNFCHFPERNGGDFVKRLKESPRTVLSYTCSGSEITDKSELLNLSNEEKQMTEKNKYRNYPISAYIG